MNNKNIKTFFTRKNDKTMNNSENRINFLFKNNLSNKKDITMNLVHGNEIKVVDENYFPQNCDGLITNQKDAVLFVHVADCLPILFFDPVQEVIAVVHAGREGTFKNISEKMIKVFQSEFNSNPEDILVEIGPGGNVCCYEVGNENDAIINYVRKNFGQKFIQGKNIDIPAINKKQLLDTSVLGENIKHKNICTICNGNDYFSYRRGHLKDRFAGVITLV